MATLILEALVKYVMSSIRNPLLWINDDYRDHVAHEFNARIAEVLRAENLSPISDIALTDEESTMLRGTVLLEDGVLTEFRAVRRGSAIAVTRMVAVLFPEWNKRIIEAMRLFEEKKKLIGGGE